MRDPGIGRDLLNRGGVVSLLAQNKLIVATPALRDRLWADQVATQQRILEALSPGSGDNPRPSLADRVTVAACLAAVTTAILAWVEDDGASELPDLVGQAFDTLQALEKA